MVRDTAALTADIQLGTANPDPEPVLEALIRAHNRMPRNTDLNPGDLLQWDGTGLVKVDLSGASEGDLLEVQGDGTVAPAAPSGASAYVAEIEKIVVGAGGQATLDFTGIPATYEDLVVRIIGRTSAGGVSDEVTMTFNNDTGSNYDRQLLSIFGTSAPPSESLGATSMRAGLLPGDGAPASYGGQVEFLVNGYARTHFTKTISSRGSRAQSTSANGLLAWIYSGHWRSNAAVNRITLDASGSFKEGTVATLTGVGPLA